MGVQLNQRLLQKKGDTLYEYMNTTRTTLVLFVVNNGHLAPNDINCVVTYANRVYAFQITDTVITYIEPRSYDVTFDRITAKSVLKKVSKIIERLLHLCNNKISELPLCICLGQNKVN